MRVIKVRPKLEKTDDKEEAAAAIQRSWRSKMQKRCADWLQPGDSMAAAVDRPSDLSDDLTSELLLDADGCSPGSLRGHSEAAESKESQSATPSRKAFESRRNLFLQAPMDDETEWSEVRNFNDADPVPRAPKKRFSNVSVFADAWRYDLYPLLEDPGSSVWAQMVSICILSTIIFSIACFIIETLPELKHVPRSTWEGIEVFCTVIFTVEYVLRLSVCQVGGITQWQFATSPANVFDLLAILPFYLKLCVASSEDDTGALRVLRAVRLIRLFRIFKLGKYASGMRMMADAVKNSSQALSVLGFFLAIAVILFSSALYYVEAWGCPVAEELSSKEMAIYQEECRDSGGTESESFGLCCDEHGSPNDFTSIIDAFWWTIVTMTTVGYGEVYPRTLQGKMVGAATMLAGILLVALPVAIVGRKFQEAYDVHVLESSKKQMASMKTSLNRKHSGVVLEGLQPPPTPVTGLGQKLRKLRVRDVTLHHTVNELSDLFDEADKVNETMYRFNVAELYRKREVNERFGKILTTFTDTLQ